MWSRRALIGGIAGSAACKLRLPDPPALDPWTWEIDRSALPALQIRALHVARVGMAPRDTTAGERSRVKADGPITVYLLQHPTAGWSVVDAGYGRVTAQDSALYPGKGVARLLDLRMARTLVDALPDLGLLPADIERIYVTHLHHDHVGGAADLPGATLVLDEREWLAGQRGTFRNGYDPAPYLGRKPVFIAWAGPYGPFPRHQDIHGDGSLIALDAPGHTPGEVCWLVNRPTKSYLLTGDAAWVDANWERPAPVGYLPAKLLADDWRLQYEQLWRIHAWVARYPEIQVISGHEPLNLDRLPPWPAPFP